MAQDDHLSSEMISPMADSTIKLYAGVRSRASIVRWYLEELQVPYEIVQVDLAAGEHLQPPYLAINPFGKVPAIQDGDVTLYESGAILLYLADKYGQLGTTPQHRALIYQWVLFGNATLGQGIFSEATREKELVRMLTPLNQLFSQQPFLLGDSFTVADVAVGSVLAYIPMMLPVDLSPYPEVLNYIQRLTDRPACQKGMLGKS
jgi:glutathione S-transferase